MDDLKPLLPTTYTTSRRHQTELRVGFPPFAITTVGLPFTAFVFCVYWSTTYHFRESTATHCQVDNYLPSVSAAIGSFTPQKYVWLICILLHYPPRLYIAGQYFQYLKNSLEPRCFKLAKATWLLNVCEVTCLVGLTLVSSTYFYPLHAFFFMTFIITSIVYMVSSCYLLTWRRSVEMNHIEARSLRWKQRLTFINLVGFFLAGYCFVRHNSYCEDGVYSLFALFEYVVVLSNMAFHLTAYFDFGEMTVSISTSGISFS